MNIKLVVHRTTVEKSNKFIKYIEHNILIVDLSTDRKILSYT